MVPHLDIHGRQPCGHCKDSPGDGCIGQADENLAAERDQRHGVPSQRQVDAHPCATGHDDECQHLGLQHLAKLGNPR